MQKIPFNIPYICGKEQSYIEQAIQRKEFSGDGYFTNKCAAFLEQQTGAKKVLLTPSCTHALEMAALLCDIQKGDEVIMSSFTFVSSANAFVLRGAKIRFIDINPNTMNIDAERIEQAITSKTKAILVMHYAGVACNMSRIMAIAEQKQLWVIEDAAQCLQAYYNQKHLGAIGHIGAFSFHATKNIHCGEGGALLVNDPELVKRAEIIREKGTNRRSFQRGEVEKYSWVDIGSSYLLGELPAAFLAAQLEYLEEITSKRLVIWQQYYTGMQLLAATGKVELSPIPINCQHNAHIFYIKLENETIRLDLINHLKRNNIAAYFHYIPLHSAKAGKKYGTFVGEDVFTTTDSTRLLRLPLYADLQEAEIERVITSIVQFFEY